MRGATRLLVVTLVGGAASSGCGDGPTAVVHPPPPLTPGPSVGVVSAGGGGWSGGYAPDDGRGTGIFLPNQQGGFGCLVATGGSVHCWGWNWLGMVGDGTGEDAPEPVRLAGPSSFVSVSSGAAHSCALTRDGEVWCWGANAEGQAGSPGQECVPGRACVDRPTRVPLPEPAKRVRAGGAGSCAVTRGDAVYCWGGGVAARDPSPILVQEGGGEVQDLGVGDVHGCVLREGRAWCWGFNGQLQLGVATGGCSLPGNWLRAPCSAEPVEAAPGRRFVALSAGGKHTCGLTPEGRAWCWGQVPAAGEIPYGWGGGVPIREVGDGRPLARIAAGPYHDCGVTTGGDVVCWGKNDAGQLGEPPGPWRFRPVTVSGSAGRYVEVATSLRHTCAVTRDGEVHCWGSRARHALGDGVSTPAVSPEPVLRGVPVASVSVGIRGACALTTEGSPYCWGEGAPGDAFAGSLGAAAGGREFGLVSRGADHTCGVTKGGQLLCWGANGAGQLGDGTFQDRALAVPVSLGAEALDVSAGVRHTCALTRDGAAWCWGSNAFGALGQLASGPGDSRPSPGRVAAVPALVRIHAGSDFTCGLAAGGEAWCWGANARGQLGLGGPGVSGLGVVAGAHRFRSLALSRDRAADWGGACGLDQGGQAWCWGANGSFRLGIGNAGDYPTPVAAAGSLRFVSLALGGTNACGVEASGELHCWGFVFGGDFGAALPAADAGPRSVRWETPFVSVSAGEELVCGVTSGARLVCWGSRADNAVGSGIGASRHRPEPVPGAPRVLHP